MGNDMSGGEKEERSACSPLRCDDLHSNVWGHTVRHEIMCNSSLAFLWNVPKVNRIVQLGTLFEAVN